MKLVALIILAILSTSYASDISDLQEEVSDTESSLQSLTNELARQEAAYKKLKKEDGCVGPFCRIRQEDTHVREAMQILLRGGTVDGVTYRGIDNLKKDISEHRSSLRQQKEELRREEKRLEKERKEQEQARARSAREDKKRQDALIRSDERDAKLKDRELESIRRRLRTMDVESDINNLEYKTLSAEDRIREIQDAYDKSLLGAYLEAKMTLLLSSNVLCESVNSCSGGKRTSPGPEKGYNLKEVFPNSTTAAGSSPTRGGSGRQ